MKSKRFLAVLVLSIIALSVPAYSSQPEDSLITRLDESVYIVLKLDNTANFLKWVFSSENINTFMPLILSSEESNEILGGIEIISAVVQNTPIRSAAMVVGMNKADIKLQEPFFQMSFTVDPSVSSIVKKMAQGEADAVDVAKLLLGSESPLASFAETMIKVEKAGDNIFKIDNEVFLKAEGDLVLLATALKDIQGAVDALNNPEQRMFTKIPRKFKENDFTFLHVDIDTAAELDEDDELDDLNPQEYFDKPVNAEFAFKRLADKFTISTALNFSESMKKEYREKYLKKNYKPVKGGNIDIDNTGGTSSPLLAFGSYLNIDGFKEHPELKAVFNSAVRQLKNRFGITEDEFTKLFTGPFSFVVNDRVMIEGFNIPALYISQSGAEGAASAVFGKLAKSQHFSKVQDGILQVDSSLSPVSCLVSSKGDKINIDFAELSSLSDKPELSSGLSELMKRDSISSLWLDFAGIQSWINDDKNGVFAVLTPMASIMGYGDAVRAFRDVMSAELSVPSMSIYCVSPEEFYTEFNIAEIKPENGLFAKLIKVYREFNKKNEKKDEKPEAKSEDKE